MKRAAFRSHDSGFTLVETIVTIVVLTIAVTMIALAGTNGLRLMSASERTAIASNFQADVLAKARQTDFAELGFYTNQVSPAGASYSTGGSATLPGIGTGTVREPVVVLGATAPGVLPFDVRPVETFLDDDDKPRVAYRATTWVTTTPIAAGAGSISAKRVTVLTEWAPVAAQNQMDGTCTNEQVRCSVQTIVRAATGADIDGDGRSAWATAPCNATSPSAAAICETYVRSGRVLDGSTMVTASDLPAQREPVDVYARTATPMRSVVATWRYTVRTSTGSTVVNNQVELEGSGGGTRWSATVQPDANDSSPRGDIRPGSVTVTFTATPTTGAAVTATSPAFWSVGLDSYGALAVEPASVTGACTASGGTRTFAVTGHSAGLVTGASPTSAQDSVAVTFPRRIGAVVDTVTVQATLVSTSPVVEVIAGTPVEVATRAVWSVTAPPTSDCSLTERAVVQVKRAVDRTVTNIPLPQAGA